jgi:hypothetical protein
MNQQAFPNPHRTDLTGMTLRDYFAAKALPFAQSECALSGDYDVNNVAELAYQFADAMLKERGE